MDGTVGSGWENYHMGIECMYITNLFLNSFIKMVVNFL